MDKYIENKYMHKNINRKWIEEKINMIKKDTKMEKENIIKNNNYNGIIISNILNKGNGLMTKFKRGDIICEYSGRLRSDKEARKYIKLCDKEGFNTSYLYIFDYKNIKYCIDAIDNDGSFGRNINHSCKRPT